MGIRFFCPNGHKLHVKSFLAGKRGICPECGVKVDIPGDSENSAEEIMRRADIALDDVRSDSNGAQKVSWYVRSVEGDQFGPASETVFKSWIAEGRVASDSQLTMSTFRSTTSGFSSTSRSRWGASPLQGPHQSA